MSLQAERLAEAVNAGFESAAAHHYEAVKSALLAYRAEITPPLRTRAEVDAEIAGIVRDWGGGSMGPFGADRFHRLQSLIAEHTVPDGDALAWDCPNCRRKP